MKPLRWNPVELNQGDKVATWNAAVAEFESLNATISQSF
jgi:hypothetical protein